MARSLRMKIEDATLRNSGSYSKCRKTSNSHISHLATLCLLLIASVSESTAQTDYNVMTNWAYHPDKLINLLADYNLDVAVFDTAMEVDSVIEIENRSIENTGTDVFFVHPTYLSGTYLQPGNVAINEQPFSNIFTGIIAQGGLLAKYGRFYAPLYRQATPPSFLGNPNFEAQAAAVSVAYGDVHAAFMHYLDHQSGGNDFILAAHSQGSYLLSMLLQDVIAEDESLRERMIAAVPAGVAAIYDDPGEGPGAWWNGLDLCSTIEQCGCVMNWRSFPEGHNMGLNPVNSGSPAFNPLLVDSGWVAHVIDPELDYFYQDSLFYGNESEPLRYYIAPNGGDVYGSGTGFVAFDGLYSIRHRRTSTQGVGFWLEHSPAENDQRPDDLANEEDDPLFEFWGYHRKDYHVYLFALLEQLDAKLESCGALGNSFHTESNCRIEVFPNPSANHVQLMYGRLPLSDTDVEVYSLSGKSVKRGRTTESGSLNLDGLPAGLYLLKSKRGTVKVAVE